jgi:hypothetical protein
MKFKMIIIKLVRSLDMENLVEISLLEISRHIREI